MDLSRLNETATNAIMQLSAENLKLPASAAALMPYGLKMQAGGAGGPSHGALMAAGGAGHSALVAAAAAHYHPSVAQTMTQAAFEFHRAQLYDYNARLYQGLRAYPHGITAHPAHAYDPIAAFYQGKYDPRARFMHEEPKPNHSYIGLIGMAILSSKDKKLVLSDIYQWILDNYNYFRTRGPGWRNSIRHNLSLNDCFIKSGRSANGKGHYWAVHPANVEDFKKGDFRRRKAQRKVRKHMGLAVPDDEDSPSPPPQQSADVLEWQARLMAAEARYAAEDREREAREREGRGDGEGEAGEGGKSPRPEDGGAKSPSTAPHPAACSPRSTEASSPEVSPRVSAAASVDSRLGVPGVLPPPHGAGLAAGLPRPLAAHHLPHPAVPFPHHPHALKCIGLPTPPPSAGRKRLFDVESLLAPEAKSAAENNNKLLSPPMNSPYSHMHKRLRMSEDGLREGSSQEKEEDEEDVKISVDSDDEDLDVEVTEEGRRESVERRRSDSGPLTPRSGRDIDAHSSSSSPGVCNMSRVTAESDRSPARSSSASEGEAEGRGPFTSPLPERPVDGLIGGPTRGGPMGHHVVLHPSAFRAGAAAAAAGVGHGMSMGALPPSTATAWSSLPPHGYPLSYPGMPGSTGAGGLSPAEAAAAAQRWQEAFSRIVQRSYDNAQNLKLEV